MPPIFTSAFEITIMIMIITRIPIITRITIIVIIGRQWGDMPPIFTSALR